MAESTTLKKRTIQHPGFEFFETDMSIYKEYVQENDALVVGYFAKGPINTPVSLKNLNDYTVYFGAPESEAEIYFYKGIESIINAGGTVTAIRLPYDNSTATLTEGGVELNYKALVGSFAEEVTDDYTGLSAIPADIKNAYEGGAVKFKNIAFKNKELSQNELTQIIGGTSSDDFAIVNKYNDVLTPKGNEIFITVIGAGNAIRTQGLNVGDDSAPAPAIYVGGSGEAFTSDNKEGLYFSRDRLKWQSNGELDESGNMLTVAHSFEGNLLSWYPTIPTYSKTNEHGEDEVFIDPRKDDKITVIVSKIKPSLLEGGKFNIEILETFSGSVFKGSIDPISNESDYIGDIINESSSYISFYGKARYQNYDKETDSIYVTGMEPLRFSWADGCPSVADADSMTNLKKVFVRAEMAEQVDYVKSVLEPALKKVRNNINFLYRDVYDFGLSSVIAYMTPAVSAAGNDDVADGLAAKVGDLIYKPSFTNPSETTSSNFLNSSKWRKVVYAFARHCQYQHKLSMFHADGPRKLVLNGNLSRSDDLFQDQMDVVFTAKKVQTVAIKDSTYLSVNTNWYEIMDEFNKTLMWIPNSVKLAGDITYNDINAQVWEAPAGHTNGLVTNVIRPAFNPEYDTMDRLYLNCLNYASKWTDGAITIEGQKTAYGEESALNRINVRRLMIWLERYTQKVAATYMYVPNTAENRSRFESEVKEEFKRCQTLGGLTAYRVVCNDETTPPAIQDRNEMRITCMVQPTRTTEFILANFVITKTGVNLEELSPVF